MTYHKGQRRGKFQTEKIGNAIKAFEGKEFTTHTVHLITRVSLNTIHMVLREKVSKGIIKKCIGKNRYYKVDSRTVFTKILSKGFVADLVWHVLKSASEPMTLQEIFRGAQNRTQRTLVRKSIRTVLCYWKRNKHVKVSGVPGKYRYELEAHAQSHRPIAIF